MKKAIPLFSNFTRVSLAVGLLIGLSASPSVAAPSRADDLFQMGQVFASQKSDDQAIDAFIRAIAADPKHVKARLSLATIYGRKKEYKKALDEVDAAIKLEPKAYVAYKIKGLLHEDLKQYPEAAAAYQAYLKAAPSDKVKDAEELVKRIEKFQSKPAATGAQGDS